MTMTDQELKDLVASLVTQVAETSRDVKQLSKELRGVSNNQGFAAESFFYNSLESNPEIGGIHFDRVIPNLMIGPKGKKTELDVVMINGESIAIIEVKYRPHVEDLAQLEAHIEKYRNYFTEHKNYKIYGGLAGMSMPMHVIEAAQERGLFILQQVGNVMEVVTEGMRAH